MYLYIYDEFLQEKKYRSILDKIENRLTDLEIKGKVKRLSILKNIKEIIEDEIEEGISTVVAVGDDQTIFKAINVLAYHPEVTLGVVPVGPNNNIAKILGIPLEEEACEILSSRIIKKLDLGKINYHFFISDIHMDTRYAVIQCDEQYTITLQNPSPVFVYNFNFRNDATINNPCDGKLELVIKDARAPLFHKLLPERKNESFFTVKRLRVESSKDPIKITIDKHHVIKTPADISVMPQRLKVIVGKERMFE